VAARAETTQLTCHSLAARRLIVLAALAVVGACSSAPSAPSARAPTTSSAADLAAPGPCSDRDDALGPVVDALLATFDQRPVLAFGEHHGSLDEHRVLRALVCDPRFGDTVDVVVVEFANQRLQGVLDRYMAGDDVSADELASVWRESTQRSGVWESPVYPRFLAAVRAANRGREADKQIRVLAGDPPLDWSTITDTSDCDTADPTCLEHWDREESYADVVLREVIDRHTALLVAGQGHMMRRLEPGPPPSVPQRVEAEHPGTVTVILTHSPFPPDGSAESTEAGALLASLPVPTLVPLAESPLGRLGSCLVDDGADCSNHVLAELADAYLYLGG
jgi:hypothetical protein